MIQNHPVVYLNVQTQRTAMEVGGWFPEKMGVSVAVLLTKHVLRVFLEKDVPELVGLLSEARCVVGYNLTGFDLRILQGYMNVNLEPAKQLDLLREFEAATGSRVPLPSVEKATLQTSQRHDGLATVQFWKEGRIADIVEAASNRVLAVKALHEIGGEKGRLLYYPSGSGRRKSIRVNWLQ